MKDDPMELMQGAITRDLVDVAGIDQRLAAPIAEFAAASVALLFARTQPYFPESSLVRARDRKLREMNRRALANVNELVELTGLERSHLYRILRTKVAGARRGKP